MKRTTKAAEKANEKINEIMEQLEAGVADMFTSGKYEQYLRVMSKFHNYSLNNCILIAIQCPEASAVAGYKAWAKDFKRQVRKGEKAIRILAPIIHKKTKEVMNDDGNVEESEVKFITYRTVNVFDISQTDGEALPSICNKLTGKVKNYAETLVKLEAVSPVSVVYDAISGSANGYYSRMENRIVVDSGLSEQQTVKTLIHEIAHAMLHCEDGECVDADRETKEVQAESVAYVVCQNIGIDTSDYSFGYITGWSKGREAKELKESIDLIKKTANEIIKAVA